MHEALLAEGAIPSPIKILGLKMRPYSIGHELWLIRENNPILAGGIVSRKKIFEAVLLCSETWVGIQKMNQDFKMPFKLFIWRWLTRRHQTPIIAEDFRQYRERGSLCFKTNPPTPGQVIGHRPGCPILLRLQMFLVEHFHLSDSEAWDYPLGLASMKFCSYLETNGCLEVQNELDVETENFQKTNDARLAVFIAQGMTDEQAWAKLFEEGLSCPA